jgi:hypothetical protein
MNSTKGREEREKGKDGGRGELTRAMVNGPKSNKLYDERGDSFNFI